MAVPCRRLLWILLLLMQIVYGTGKISDLRLCGDPACNDPVSEGRTLIKYTSNDPQILSFGINVPVIIFSKSAGSKQDLWGGEINGKRGYFPMRFVREGKLLKANLPFTVSTEETSDSKSHENLNEKENSKDSEVLHNRIVRHADDKTQEDGIQTTKASSLEVEAQTQQVSSKLPAATAEETVISRQINNPDWQENESTANPSEMPAEVNLLSKKLELPTDEPANSVMHATLKNVWETVRDSKVLSLPWDSIQTVADFSSNYPKSLDMLSDNLLQRIGVNADSENIASAPTEKFHNAHDQCEVFDGTTLCNDLAVDGMATPVNADTGLPTKQQQPVLATEWTLRQESAAHNPKPSVHIASSFSHTPEFNKASDTPSLIDTRMEAKIDNTNVDPSTNPNNIDLMNTQNVPSSESVLSVQTSSESDKLAPTKIQQETVPLQNSIIPTQSISSTPTTVADVSERAYMGEIGKSNDVPKAGDESFLPPSESLGSSHLPVEETQWSSSENSKVGNLGPSATAGKVEYIEEGGGWFSTLKRTLLGANDPGQEDPSAAEAQTRGSRSWMGKEGSQGLPRSDSGFFSEAPASQSVEELDDDDTLVDIDDDTLVDIDDDDEDDDEDDLEDEETEATLDDLIGEESASKNSVKEDGALKFVQPDDAGLELEKDNTVSDQLDKPLNSAADSEKGTGNTDEVEANLNTVSDVNKPYDTSTTSHGPADTLVPAEYQVPPQKEDVLAKKSDTFYSTVHSDGDHVSARLPEKSGSAPSKSTFETVEKQQDEEKDDTVEKASEELFKVESDGANQAWIHAKEGMNLDENVPKVLPVMSAGERPSPHIHEQLRKENVESPLIKMQQDTASTSLHSNIPADIPATFSEDLANPKTDSPTTLISSSSLNGIKPSEVVGNLENLSISPSSKLPAMTASIPVSHDNLQHEEKIGTEKIVPSNDQKKEIYLQSEYIEASTNNEREDLVVPSPDALRVVNLVETKESDFEPLSVLEQTKPKESEIVVEAIPVEADQSKEETSEDFFAGLDVLAAGKAYVDWMRPYMQLLVDVLPEPIHASLMEYEEQGLSPRVLVFTVISGGFLTCIIIAHYMSKKGSGENVLKLKLCQMDKKLFEAAAERDIVKEDLDSTKQKTIDLQSNLSQAQEAIELLDSELLSAKTECGKLQATVASLEEQLETATEAGLELNNMLSDFLTSQNEGHKLQESVAMLQEQLDLQKNSLSDMQSNAKNKSQQYSALKEEHDDALLKIEDLEMQNKKLRLDRDELESSCETGRHKEEMLEERTNQLEESNKQLLREAEIWNQRVHELQEQVETYCADNKALKDSMSTKLGEIEVLKDIIQQLKAMQDDDTDAAGDSEKLERLMNVSRVTAELNAVSQEKSCIVEHLSTEIEKRKSLEDSLAKTVAEVEQLRDSHTVLSQQRDESLTKLQVLSGYFKEKEIELQRELGVQEAMRQQSQESVLSVGQRAAVYEQEVSMYKSQIDDLKKEIDSQARSYKNQIAQHESKAHDSWLAARAAERKAEDARQEAALLRNKLTLIEQEKESMQGQGDSLMVKPLPKRFTGSNGEVPSPPRLESEPSDLPVSGPPSLLREPLDSPRRMPFLPLDRPMPPPAFGFPPPFMRERYPPPPPMFDHHGPPFDLHGPPPPPYHPHQRPFDPRMSPPLPRRSPPLRRMSPPFDPHSSLPPRDYRSPPPIDRRGPPDRLQSPPPFDRRPPSGRRSPPSHLPRDRNFPGPYEREYREGSPPRFHDRGPPPGVVAPGVRQGPPPLRRDPFPDNRIGALTDPRTSSPMTDQLPDPHQVHPTTQV